MSVEPARIYLDYAATTPVATEVAEAMRAASAAGGFNPSSLHAEGRRARALLDAARDRVAACWAPAEARSRSPGAVPRPTIWR